jgi:hypothetical protein
LSPSDDAVKVIAGIVALPIFEHQSSVIAPPATFVGAGVPKINATVSALRFIFNVTLDRPDLAKHLAFTHEPRSYFVTGMNRRRIGMAPPICARRCASSASATSASRGSGRQPALLSRQDSRARPRTAISSSWRRTSDRGQEHEYQEPHCYSYPADRSRRSRRVVVVSGGSDGMVCHEVSFERRGMGGNSSFGVSRMPNTAHNRSGGADWINRLTMESWGISTKQSAHAAAISATTSKSGIARRNVTPHRARICVS